jgi:hypothetical protein
MTTSIWWRFDKDDNDDDENNNNNNGDDSSNKNNNVCMWLPTLSHSYIVATPSSSCTVKGHFGIQQQPRQPKLRPLNN